MEPVPLFKEWTQLMVATKIEEQLVGHLLWIFPVKNNWTVWDRGSITASKPILTVAAVLQSVPESVPDNQIIVVLWLSLTGTLACGGYRKPGVY